MPRKYGNDSPGRPALSCSRKSPGRRFSYNKGNMKKTTALMILALPAAVPLAMGQGQLPTQATPQDQGTGEQRVQQSQDLNQKMNELHSELEDVSSKLSDTYEEALKDKEVRDSLVEYEKVLRKEMVQLAPDLEESIDTYYKQMEELRDRDPENMDPEERLAYQEQMTEHHGLKAQLTPVELQARQDEEVAEHQNELQQVLLAEMRDIEPDFEQLLARRNELAEEFSSIQRKMMEQQQGAQQQTVPQQQGGRQQAAPQQQGARDRQVPQRPE